MQQYSKELTPAKTCLVCGDLIPHAFSSVVACGPKCKEDYRIFRRRWIVRKPKTYDPGLATKSPKKKKSKPRLIINAAYKKIQALTQQVQILSKEKETSKYNPFYHSREWRELRYQVLKAHRAKHGSKCLVCNAENKVLHVDHVKPRSKFPELALDRMNLQVLCEDCNLGKSNKDKTDWRTK